MRATHSRSGIFAALIVSVLAVALPEAHAQRQVGSAHHDFHDVEHWVKVFESPDRDQWQKPDQVVRALNLKPGETVVDLGAGTGYFTRRFAAAVAPSGRSIGLDVEPAMVDYMKHDAERGRLTNYDARVVKPNDPGLSAASVDVVFLCDAYHHIEDRPAYFRRIIPALKPGGRVVIVDFHKRPLPVGPPPAHKIAGQQTIDEFRQAGYRLVRRHDFLPYQYVFEFEPAK
jgi:arsenite methyltransferase